MKHQGKASTVRRAAIVLAVATVVGFMAGCTTGGGRGGSALIDPVFSITFDPRVPGDEAVTVWPNEGDAWLNSSPAGGSTIVWKTDREFGIKFVQIDDQSQKPKKKLGDEGDDWNLPTKCNDEKTECEYTLTLEKGNGHPKKKEIRGAKYIVASPSGCSDATSIPAGCMYQDPVIIVRY